MELRTATVVDIGTTYEKNDDRALVDQVIYDCSEGTQALEQPLMCVVCDGVGGNAGGGTAAELILQELRQLPIREDMDTAELQEALTRANERIFAEQAKDPAFAKMCSTIAGAIFLEERTLIFHAGDSRIYRFDGQYLSRMTKDHSLVQQMVDMGVLTEEEAAEHPERNKISRCMGIAGSLPVEIYESGVGIRPGEIFLLCSDGLWEAIPDRQISRILREDTPLLEKAQTLVDIAKDLGSTDNVTACLCAAPEAVKTEKTSQPFILD